MAASNPIDQIERNRATVDDPSDLMKLVSHVEVKDRGTVRSLYAKPWFAWKQCCVADSARHESENERSAGAFGRSA